eukprot:2007234-Rhodomonas_salina.1
MVRGNQVAPSPSPLLQTPSESDDPTHPKPNPGGVDVANLISTTLADGTTGTAPARGQGGRGSLDGGSRGTIDNAALRIRYGVSGGNVGSAARRRACILGRRR